MERNGRKICEVLKAIRRRIALLNNIEYQEHICDNQDDCIGTCALCEKELKQLNDQFSDKIKRLEKVHIKSICKDLTIDYCSNINLSQEFNSEDIHNGKDVAIEDLDIADTLID